MNGGTRPALVFLYGPPAAGKFTIARALASELAWPLLHNHQVIDYVESVIPWRAPGFFDACADARVSLTRRALENGVSLVSTFVYAKGFDADEALVTRLHDAARAASARFCAVQLRCSEQTLRIRCVAPHRAAMKKIADVSTLDRAIREFDCTQAIKGVDSLVVDTDVHSAEAAVAAIRAHFAL